MQTSQVGLSRLLEIIVDHLDVPQSYYEKAAARHRSLGEWLHRKESTVAEFNPDIRPQGSFRYGTVVRPIRPGEPYDLDNVCLLRALTKGAITQAELKTLFGNEIKAYAKANSMLAPVTEHNRCWRLQYADEAEFHLDTLPCVPEDDNIIRGIIALGVPLELARRIVAITDRRNPHYRQISSTWLSSNPRGFARWFEVRAAMGRRRNFSESRLTASVEDVPPYEWKTPLQRSIQILKRHRDVMFFKMPELAPISMIITNLAARSYEGEPDLATALSTIIDKMPDFIRTQRPWIPNPADPVEDYADKWSKDARLEKSFWEWHAAVRADIAKVPGFVLGRALKADIQRLFWVDLTQDEERLFEQRSATTVAPTVKAVPTLIIPSAPKPWGNHV